MRVPSLTPTPAGPDVPSPQHLGKSREAEAVQLCTPTPVRESACVLTMCPPLPGPWWTCIADGTSWPSRMESASGGGGEAGGRAGAPGPCLHPRQGPGTP